MSRIGKTALQAAFALCFGICTASAQHHGAGHGHGHGSASPAVLDPITVKAEKIDAYIRNNPHQVTVVDRTEILHRNFLSVEETLDSMPGVEVRPSAGIGSRISIRGSGKSGGVLVLINGRPLNSSQYGGADLSTIPIEIVKSVTVFKPPVPVWLGPGASGGAISIVTHDLPEDGGAETPAAERNPNIRVKLSGGSYGLAEGSIGYNQPLSGGNFMATAAGGHRDGKRTNNDRDKGIFSLHWDRRTQRPLQYEVNGRYYISEYGSPGPEDNPTPDARQRYGKGSLDLQAKGFAGESGEYALKGYADHVDLRDESQFGTTADLTDLKVGVKADADWSGPEGLWALRLGGILERDDVDHTITGEHHRVTSGVHAQYDRHFAPVTATIGVRGDHTGDFGLHPGVKGGLSYAPFENGLIKANAGYSVNVPTFGQLYQPSHGSYDQVRGNPDLDEERIWNYTLGTEYRFRKDRVVEATLFRADTRDLIVHRRGEDRIYRPVNADRAWRHGMELSVRYAWDNGLAVDVNYILQDSENRETGKALAYTPTHKFKTALTYPLPKWGTRLEASLRYQADRFSEAEGRSSQKLDDFVTIDLKAVHPLTFRGMPLEVFANIHNLFDTDFEFHHGYPDDGVRLVAGIHLTL